MKKHIRKQLLQPLCLTLGLCFLLSLLHTNSAYATHISGGNIYYTCLGNNEYIVHLELFRDCQGIQVPSSATISVNSASCSFSKTMILGKDTSFTYMTPFLCGLSTSCNSTFPGFEVHRYSDTIALDTVLCNDIVFEYSACCRSSAITNLVSPSSQPFYIESTLDNTLATCNSSPQMVATKEVFFCNNTPGTYNFTAVDPDGDSLVYSFANALSASPPSGLITYQPGYSLTSQIASSPASALDPTTGVLTFNANISQNPVVTVRIDEYRNGNLIGSVHMDQMIYTLDCSMLSPQTNFGYTLGADSITFTDSSKYAISWVWDFGDGNMSTVQNPVHVYAAYGAYEVCLTTANNCSNGDTLCKTIYYDLNDVWPGDANYDGVADAWDILPIGLIYNQTGPARSNPTMNWVPQYAPAWNGVFPWNENWKHADCDGDGIVGSTDLIPIALNYGLTHPKTGNRNSSVTGVTLSLDAQIDSATAGQSVGAAINLGDATTPANNVYGLAFSINYDPNLVDSSSVMVDFNNSWLGTEGVDMVTITKQIHAQGRVDIGLTRTNQTTQSGQGEIGFIIVTVDNLSGKRNKAEYLNLSLSNLVMIDINGDTIETTMMSDSVWVQEISNGIFEVPNLLSRSVQVYPNPTEGNMVIKSNSVINRIQVLDITGKRLYTQNGGPTTQSSLDLSSFQAGLYFLQVETADGIAIKKVTVCK